ncbi:MAG: hypothetical protein WDA00_00575 [Eubacteriales bacterium]
MLEKKRREIKKATRAIEQAASALVGTLELGTTQGLLEEARYIIHQVLIEQEYILDQLQSPEAEESGRTLELEEDIDTLEVTLNGLDEVIEEWGTVLQGPLSRAELEYYQQQLEELGEGISYFCS